VYSDGQIFIRVHSEDGEKRNQTWKAMDMFNPYSLK